MPIINRILERLRLVDVVEQEKPTYRQASKGRPGKDTKYIKSVTTSFDISWSVDPIRLVEAESLDGIFPLITNAKGLTAEEVLRAYKRQPIIEKRFSQLKTDFAVFEIGHTNSSPAGRVLLRVCRADAAGT
ncbi:MAG: hypothetical protein O3C40_26905 [Planctomycetota bacterium]|nr:hypothetical protein [Planctomycetota bacterium]